MVSKLRSTLTGKLMTSNQHEFRVWNFQYSVGDTYTLETGSKYRVLAMSAPRNEGSGSVSHVVLIEGVK